MYVMSTYAPNSELAMTEDVRTRVRNLIGNSYPSNKHRQDQQR